MKNKSFLVAIVLLVIFVAGFFALQKSTVPTAAPVAQSESSADSSFQVVPAPTSLLIKPHSPVKGTFGAKVTVVEYLDPECESCAAMAPIVRKILSEHEKDIQFVVRYMTYHGNSKLVANILEGARAENKYWLAMELLFEKQDQWANHHNPNPEMIPEILKPLGLNMKKIMADAKAGKYDKQILEDVEDGKKLGVSGTPTFFVNGHQLQHLGYEPLKAAILENLQK